MKNKGTILVCDNDASVLEELQKELQEHDMYVDVITSAQDLVPQAIRTRPAVVIVNPDLPGFNAYDVCKHLKKDLQIPIILLINPNSTTRSNIDECDADDVLTKPLHLENAAFLIEKHITINS